MVQVIQAQHLKGQPEETPAAALSKLNIADLEDKFALKLADNEQFFAEWLGFSPELTDQERQYLDRVKINYLSLVKRRPIAENIVKMVVLSPLLDLANFYRPPFDVKTETSVEISTEDQGEIVKGRIDVLVLKQQFWLLVIESKSADFSLLRAIPQALVYMLANSHPQRAAFGLVTNGSDFLFLKLTKQNIPQYALSDKFTLLKRENELYRVLEILKNIGQVLS